MPRPDAKVHLELTERELRATSRALDLVIGVLRPALAQLPDEDNQLVRARIVLEHAAEQAGISLGVQAVPS